MATGIIDGAFFRAGIIAVRALSRRFTAQFTAQFAARFTARSVRREEAMLSVRLAAIDIQDLIDALTTPLACASNWDSALSALIDASSCPARVRRAIARERVSCCAADLVDHWLARPPAQRSRDAAEQLFIDAAWQRVGSSTDAGVLYARALRFLDACAGQFERMPAATQRAPFSLPMIVPGTGK